MDQAPASSHFWMWPTEVTLDTHRELRTGQGETVLGQGKHAWQVTTDDEDVLF